MGDLRSLRAGVKEWTDWDGAAAALATVIGVVDSPSAFGGEKWLFWSDNEVGNAIYRMLDELVEIGVLECREEPDRQYRWNPAFDLQMVGRRRRGDGSGGRW